jgi:hypothetical protein
METIFGGIAGSLFAVGSFARATSGANAQTPNVIDAITMTEDLGPPADLAWANIWLLSGPRLSQAFFGLRPC